MVSKIVILAAVAFAPTVTAFTPGQLEGVWYCVNDDNGARVRLTPGADPSDTEWQDIPEKETRSFYFEKPDAGKKTLLTGSMYSDWSPTPTESGDFQGDTATKRHDRYALKGTIVSATKAELWLNPSNGDVASTDFNAKPGPTPEGDENPFTPYIPVWNPASPPSGASIGPYSIYQVDADHFTLAVYSADQTASNCLIADVACLANDAAIDECTCDGFTAVVSTEKCVRGLPRRDETCGYINTADATYLDGDNAHRICRGNLQCVDNTGGDSQNFGECSTVKCCSAQLVPVTPPQYYRPPTYYQPTYNPYYQSSRYTWG